MAEVNEVGFIAKVNEIYSKLNVIVRASEVYDEKVVETLNRLEDQDLSVIIEDLKKSNYLGNRKIDIDLALNNLSTTELPSYSKANVILVSGVKLEIPFDNGSGGVLELNSHADIKNYIVNHELYIENVVDTEMVVNEAFGEQTAFIRVRDADGKSSNIERIELFVFSGSVVSQKVSYFWAKTTSALETLANRVGDIIQLGNDIDSIVTLSQRIDELISLQDEIGKLIDLHTNLNSLLINANNIADIKVNSSNVVAITNISENILKLNSIYEDIEEILASKEYVQIATSKATLAAEKAQIATEKAQIATEKAQIASEQANIAKQKVDTIQAITVQGQTLAAGQSVSVSYNPVTNKFTFGIPQGLKGDRGEAFQVNSIGTFAQRALYDNQLANFSFLAIDVVVNGSTIPHIYFKLSNASGDWSVGAPFGRGDKGDTGDTGNGITQITFTSTSHASGLSAQSGGDDEYTITYTDGTTDTFTVHNGIDSDFTTASESTLTNKTIDDMSNTIGANHVHYKVRNNTGTTILKGTVVKAASTQTGTDYINVEPTTSSTDTGLGIVISDISVSTDWVGLIIAKGEVKNINTNMWNVGTKLYTSNGGTFTNVKPTTNTYQVSGYVHKKHSSQGVIVVDFSEPIENVGTISDFEGALV
ncbi:coiled-coil domain-containing protein [Aliarcobacter cryaerophilus]|uniref:coiled-coil domain-containing protein n=1 Tax=Aliarcobacter cryaerophilus TaxID=28198 RepID=UPI0021B3203F|nr:hypothetical protein [Aliarcobacter cryaerophilus]MCT7513668.1 hypothetical protein [Aliarcobacter cryaerophilus]